MEGFYVETVLDAYEREVIKVFIQETGEEVFEWYNEANLDYPEDLTWHREISSVFIAGVEAGIKLQKLSTHEFLS